MIFQSIEPLEDEYLPQIVERLYLNLGFENARAFFKRLYGIDYHKLKYYHNTYPHTKVFELLGFKEYYSLILKHTEYPFIAPLSYRIEQLKFLGHLFELKGLNNRNTIAGYKSCPECDLEASYIRRSHNLPGVSVCYKHKCSLTIDGVTINKYITPDDIRYAIQAKEFADSCFDFSLNELQDIAKNIKDGEKFLPYNRRFEILLNNVSSIKDIQIPVETPSIITTHYDVLHISNNIIELICKKCGFHFCTTYFGYEMGFLCPNCQSDISDEDFITQKYEMILGDEYTCLSKDNSKNRTMVFHSKCKQIFSVHMEAMLDNISCPCCKENKLVKDRLPNHKIISFDNAKKLFLIENKSNKENNYLDIKQLNDLIKNESKLLKANQETAILTNKQSDLISDIELYEYLKSNFKEEIFRIDDIDDASYREKFRSVGRILCRRKVVNRLAQEYYSLCFNNMNTEELIEKYYINGQPHNGFFASYSFWERHGIKVKDRKYVYLCSDAVSDETLVIINNLKAKIFPLPDYYTNDKKKEAELIFSINIMKGKIKNKEALLKYSLEYTKDNLLDLEYINKHLKERLDEKQI